MDTQFWFEMVGYLGSVLVAVSLMMKSLWRLRIINLVGASFFTVYGLLIGALPVAGLAERHWALRDLLSAERYERVGSDLAQSGLYLDLAPYAAQVFRFEPLL